MDRVGVLIVSKCLSGAAMVDAISRGGYSPEFYVVEKQANPYLMARAKAHCVVPDLDIAEISRFARRHSARIDFGLTDTEDFVTEGGRDALEKDAGVHMLCVSKERAVEGSKADQRLLFERIFPGANPAHGVFTPRIRGGTAGALTAFRKLLKEIPEPVLKPDAPARGAGVGVWGNDFTTVESAEAFFLNLLSKGRVVVEQKVEGEESSFHAFSDGRHFVPAPLTRDYKRSLDGNRGRLTGGMGSYRSPGDRLPFLVEEDWDQLVMAEEAAFRRWRGRGSDPGLRGIVLYDAIMHTGRGFKVLERNSRGGNTEIINLLTTMADDFVEVCFKMLDGTLKGIRFKAASSVVTCSVPLFYGVSGAQEVRDAEVDMSRAEALRGTTQGSLRLYPMDVRLESGRLLLGSSRSIAVVGVSGTMAGARRASLEGCRALRGPLRWRIDVASPADIRASRDHLRLLRSRTKG